MRDDKKGNKYYFAIYESRRIKRGKNREEVLTVEKIGDSKELLRRILEETEELFKNARIT